MEEGTYVVYEVVANRLMYSLEFHILASFAPFSMTSSCQRKVREGMTCGMIL